MTTSQPFSSVRAWPPGIWIASTSRVSCVRSMRAILDPAAAWRQEAGAERRQAGRRGTGASEARSPRSGRALDGPPDRWSTLAPTGAKLADGVRGARREPRECSSGARAAGEHWTDPRIVGLRAAHRQPAPRHHVAHGERDQDGEPEEAAARHHPNEPRALAQVHEEDD